MKRLFLIALFNLSALGSDIDLRPEQWGLKNTGQTIYRQDDALTQGAVIGRAGVDVQFNSSSIVKKRDIVVAVIDHGLDDTHPDLIDNLWQKEGPCFPNREEKECRGWNFLDDNPTFVDTNGHGTHVAGIIGAVVNDLGVDGLAGSVVKIMPLKVLGDNLEGLTYNKKVLTHYVAKAIDFALDNGAQVINMSLGWPKVIHEAEIEMALNRAAAMNVPIVVASGNNNKMNPVYPCSHHTVICVGAIDNQGNKASFTNHGVKVDIYAPGEGIVSTYPLIMESRSLRIGGYERKNGSSQAAPFVASALALYRHENPEASLSQMKADLYLSAKELSFSSKYGLLQVSDFLAIKMDSLVDPILKNISEIELRDSGKFNLQIPLDILSGDVKKIKAKITLESNDVEIENKIIELDVESSKLELFFKGDVVNDMGDSHIPFKLTLEYNDKSRSYRGEFVLNRDIDRELKRNSVMLKNIPKDLVSYFEGDRKLSRLKRVFDKARLDNKEEYFYFDPKRIKEVQDFTPVSLLSTDGKSISTLELLVPKAQSVFGVFKIDLDGDGSADYMTYSLGKDELLYFKFFNEKGEDALGSHSTWFLENTGFDPISIVDRAEAFELMRIKHPVLGEINVPVFAKEWFLPSEDNSDDFFTELPNVRKNRIYYFNPVVLDKSVEIKIRTLESFDFMAKVADELNLDIGDEVNLLRIIDQSREEKNQGIVKALFIVEGFNEDQIFRIEFRNSKMTALEKLSFDALSLQNNTVDIFDDGVVYFSSLLSRNTMRYFDEHGNVKVFDSKDWSDPAFRLYNVVGGKDLVESRYYMWLVNGDDFQKLPLDRESSFPGPSFTETFDRLRGMSVLINSSLVVGNRIYMMKEVDGKFIRPIRYSVSIPTSCIVMDVHHFSDGLYKSFMCKSGGGVALRWLKLD